MAWRAGGARAERDVVRLCHRGLDIDRLPQQLLQSLRRAVSSDAAFFTTADPGTLLFTGAYQEEPLPSAGLLLLDNELAGEDVNTFTSLAGSAPHVASPDRAAPRRISELPRAFPRCGRLEADSGQARCSGSTGRRSRDRRPV